jgi:hypothetical protein
VLGTGDTKRELLSSSFFNMQGLRTRMEIRARKETVVHGEAHPFHFGEVKKEVWFRM